MIIYDILRTHLWNSYTCMYHNVFLYVLCECGELSYSYTTKVLQYILSIIQLCFDTTWIQELQMPPFIYPAYITVTWINGWTCFSMSCHLNDETCACIQHWSSVQARIFHLNFSTIPMSFQGSNLVVAMSSWSRMCCEDTEYYAWYSGWLVQLFVPAKVFSYFRASGGGSLCHPCDADSVIPKKLENTHQRESYNQYSCGTKPLQCDHIAYVFPHMLLRRTLITNNYVGSQWVSLEKWHKHADLDNDVCDGMNLASTWVGFDSFSQWI